MPNVVNEEQEKAKETLKNQGLDLQVVVEEIYDPSIPVGIVIESVPGRGEKLKTNDTVILRVSKGVEMKMLPSLQGMSLADAKTNLKSLGFKKEPVITYVESKEPKDTVLTQSPKADVEYELDIVITLEVSDGSLMPAKITKDVVIDLKGRAQYTRCEVTIKRDGVEVRKFSVPKGTASVILEDEEGSGIVVYTVLVDNSDGWVQEEVFSEEAPAANE